MNQFSWVKNGLILGTVFFIAIFLKKPVGVSTQFSVLSGIIHSSLDPSIIVEDHTRETGFKSSNAYYDKSDGKLAKNIKNPFNYDFLFVLAIPLGGFIASRLKNNKQNLEKADNKETVKKKSTFQPYLLPFLGGIILLFGARMADGCTSGHMMSGMMQGSVSGYIFAAAVFFTAIPTAIIRNKKRRL